MAGQDELSLKELALVFACLQYTRGAMKLGLQQTGPDQFTTKELDALIKKVDKALEPYRHRRQ